MQRQNPIRRTEGITCRVADGETVVYDSVTDAVHLLPVELTRVWEACSSDRSQEDVAQIAGLSIESTGLAMARLDEIDLLVTENTGFDRRRLLQRGAIVGAGLLTLPAIASMSAPASATAASEGAIFSINQQTSPTSFSVQATGFPHNTPLTLILKRGTGDGVAVATFGPDASTTTDSNGQLLFTMNQAFASGTTYFVKITDGNAADTTTTNSVKAS